MKSMIIVNTGVRHRLLSFLSFWERAFPSSQNVTWGYITRGELVNLGYLVENSYDKWYAHDLMGNRVTAASSTGVASCTANPLNQYTSVGAETTQHDFNGNLTSKGDFGASYDSRNRVLSLNNSGNTGTFKYDYRNRQVSRTINGVTTFFIWDDWNLIEERDSSGTLIQSYIHGRTVDDLVAKVDQKGAVYYHQDGLGSTVALTNQDGDVVENYSYKVFGEPTITNDLGQTLSSSTKGNRFLYTGREWMSELAIYDYRNRIYSAELGRFLQTDPIRFEAGDVNIYRYVGNKVLGYRDPWGLEIQIYSTNNAFGNPSANHAYAYNTETGETRGRNGSSGKYDDGGAPDAPESDHTHVGDVNLPEGVSGSDYMQELNNTAENGLYCPGLNDCHTSIERAAENLGGEFIPNDDYNGRFNEEDIEYPWDKEDDNESCK